MKTLYITAFLLAGIVSLQAQENKTIEKQDDIKSIKDSKAFEAKMMKQKEDKKPETKTSQLASEQGMELKKQSPAQSKASGTSGKSLPNTASFEEVLASIPNRKVVRNANPKPTNTVKGLPNTATLAEIKKTIPKN
jgi:hypothetical protein